jgi:hypothetical protein
MAHEEGGGSTMGGKILTIIIAIVVIGVIVYLWNSGLINKVTGGFGSLFPPPSATSTAFSPASPGFGGGSGGSGSGGAGAPAPLPTYFSSPPPTSTFSSPGAINPLQIPPGFTASQLSPYFKEITIAQSFSAFGTNPYGQLTLSAGLGPNESVDVTGWELKSNHGSEYIPQAVDLYQPSGFAAAQDIRLSEGQTLYLYSSAGTINLRLNECIGYLQQDLNTNPQLPLDCPYINQSQISSFTGACQNYIHSIPSCTVPDENSPQIPQNDYACQQFLNTLNYTGCFDAHVNDANFLSNQWWVWTGNNIADPYHDTINLIDRSGLLVDQYAY